MTPEVMGKVAGLATGQPPEAHEGLPMLQSVPGADQLLRAVLEEGRYGIADAMVRRRYLDLPFVEPYSEARVMHSAESLPGLTQLLIRLFMLGAEVPLQDVAACLGRDVLDDLVASGVLLEAGADIRARWLVVSFLNRYFLASHPLHLRDYDRLQGIVYVGAESYWTARFVVNCGPYRSGLDLGTGTGLLACMADARHMTAVELSPATAQVATFNAALNGLQDKVSVVQGDLYEPVRDRRFELIVANPPFMPTPAGIHSPECGDGGPTGEEVLRRVLAGLPEHLAAGGQALVYAEAFGDVDEPFIAQSLRSQSMDGLNTSIFVRSTQSLEAAGLGLTQLWQATGSTEMSAWEAWNRLVQELGATYHHSFLMVIGQGPPGVSVHHPYRA